MGHLVALDFAGRLAVVVGGGAVGTRRAESLLAAGASVRMVAPDLSDVLQARARAGEVEWRREAFAPSSLDGAWLVVAATDDSGVNDAVAQAALERHVWCVHAAHADRGTARSVAQSRRGDLVVGVSSANDPDPSRTSRVLHALVDELDSGSIDLRRGRPGPGRVILVGSGPGAADLLTLRAQRALAEADVVVTDRLGAVDALDALPDDVEVVDVGKARGRHSRTQEEITKLIVDLARQGKTVVRYKGGDPFVLGRGGEELGACLAAGIPCEVVPGVTSAFGVPALAGIPVTHRGASRGVLVTTGHQGVDPAVVEAMRDGLTVVMLMGVANLGEIAAAAIDSGIPDSTAVAVIERGSTPDQRTTRTTLAEASRGAEAIGVEAPAVIVVGAVAAEDLFSPQAEADDRG